jgi:hypothetical protein
MAGPPSSSFQPNSRNLGVSPREPSFQSTPSVFFPPEPSSTRSVGSTSSEPFSYRNLLAGGQQPQQQQQQQQRPTGGPNVNNSSSSFKSGYTSETT